MPVELTPLEHTEREDEGIALIDRQAEGNIERHPVPDQIEAVNQGRVPG